VVVLVKSDKVCSYTPATTNSELQRTALELFTHSRRSRRADRGAVDSRRLSNTGGRHFTALMKPVLGYG
jgi:hypothetical protein